MVVVPSGVQFGPKSYALFQMEQAYTASLIWNHKHDFRKKLHDTNFSHHFIISILESQNSIPTCRIFESVRVFIDAVLSWFVKFVKVLSFSCSLIGYFTQALKSDRLFFWWSFLIYLEKYAIKSKKWCNSWIIRTDESQSDYKGHQWSQNTVIKRITMAFWWSITNDIDIWISYGFYSGSLALDRKPLDSTQGLHRSLKPNVNQWFEELVIIYRLRKRGRGTLVVGRHEVYLIPPKKSSDPTNIQAMKSDWSVTSNVRIKRKKIKLIL